MMWISCFHSPHRTIYSIVRHLQNAHKCRFWTALVRVWVILMGMNTTRFDGIRRDFERSARARGLKRDTRKTYWHWIARYLGYCKDRKLGRALSPREAAEQWLSHLANERFGRLQSFFFYGTLSNAIPVENHVPNDAKLLPRSSGATGIAIVGGTCAEISYELDLLCATNTRLSRLLCGLHWECLESTAIISLQPLSGGFATKVEDMQESGRLSVSGNLSRRKTKIA